jgi:hypothetical protein
VAEIESLAALARLDLKLAKGLKDGRVIPNEREGFLRESSCKEFVFLEESARVQVAGG